MKIWTSPPADFADLLLERTAVLLQMKRKHLDPDWVKEFTLAQISTCCVNMDLQLGGEAVANKVFQGEMIRDPAFVGYFKEILNRLPEETPTVPDPTPSYGGYSYARPTHTSTRTMLLDQLSSLLAQCRETGEDIASYPLDDLMETLYLAPRDYKLMLVYLKHFAPMKLAEELGRAALARLENCVDVPLSMNGEQRDLLMCPFTGTRALFSSAPFAQVCSLLSENPFLVKIAQLLHEKNVIEHLSFTDYQTFASDAAAYYRPISAILEQLGEKQAAGFFEFWKQAGCPLYELQAVERHLEHDHSLDVDAVFANHIGYINLIYGQRFKKIDLSMTASYQEDVLTYAISKRKNHFIQLVDTHAEEFLKLSRQSLLFSRQLYTEHFNLNELTEKDLADCSWMSEKVLSIDKLEQGRLYTFPELRSLYDAEPEYIRLYHLLPLARQDDRLRVLKQLLKRNVLNWTPTDDELTVLADRLGEKPLYDWMQQDFGHITGLKAPMALRLLLHLEQLRGVLPSMSNETDAHLALRSLDTLDQFLTMDALKDSLFHTDGDWLTLSQDLCLGESFKEEYRETISRFLSLNGAYIANTYRNSLGSKHAEAYLRVVKAELMGKLPELKYFDDDLQREISFPISQRMKQKWMENSSLVNRGVEVGEFDDFFSTMLLGVQPYSTCLSYRDGGYKQCLLASFDSNKKVLYARVDDRIVGRAYLRLTKGRRNASTTEDANKFTFVDLERVAETRGIAQEDEYATLFLERPYTSGVNPDTEQAVKAAFVELANRKADEMGTMLVLSGQYQELKPKDFVFTRFYIYISKSKAGAQYLDSLNGEATVEEEGSYRSNCFMVRNPNHMGLQPLEQ